MVKPSDAAASAAAGGERSGDSTKYKGVRKRKWGKWVSEIRLPNSRDRIWLGSFNTPEKAARAFDAALFCLRGRNASFNFPNSVPEIPGAESFSHLQIREAAAKYAKENSESPPEDQDQELLPHSQPTSEYASPSSTSDGGAAAGESDMSVDWSFFDSFPEQGMSDFRVFTPDYSTQYFPPPQPNASSSNATANATFDMVDDDDADNGCDLHPHPSYLWNF